MTFLDILNVILSFCWEFYIPVPEDSINMTLCYKQNQKENGLSSEERDFHSLSLCPFDSMMWAGHLTPTIASLLNGWDRLFLPYVLNKAFRGSKVLIKLDEAEALVTKVRCLVSQLFEVTHNHVLGHRWMATKTKTRWSFFSPRRSSSLFSFLASYMLWRFLCMNEVTSFVKCYQDFVFKSQFKFKYL